MELINNFNLKPNEIYFVSDYGNDIFSDVKIISNDQISGDIAYIVLETQETLYFSGQGCFYKK